jgi:FkbH-like protein
MADEANQLLLISDFNAENLGALLQHSEESPGVECRLPPFGSVHSCLLQADPKWWQPTPHATVVWTRPQATLPSFQRAYEDGNYKLGEVLTDVESFARLLVDAASRTRLLLVPNWVLPPGDRGFGLLDQRPGVGLGHLLLQMNLRLAECLAGCPQVFVLDTARWVQRAGARAANPKLWYLGKIPFGHEVFAAAAAEIRAALRTAAGQSRKLLIVDLDDTLWGGTVGDVGWENLVLGGHDAEGEAFLDFQRALKTLTRRGIVLGLVSKNDEAVALAALGKHPEMVLHPTDFAGWRINWDDKAANVAALAAELNLGLQSVVFIDDNPAERARVREALPEVLVPEWPADKTQYCTALHQLTCFDTLTLTPEDRQRAARYTADRQRRGSAQAVVGSLEEWLATLEIRVQVEPLHPGNLARAAQLLNKTNQMNLRTRRLTETELQDWASDPGRSVWTLRVADRFGDLGLTGLLSLEQVDDEAHVQDFVLSCRVLGRRVEETMLALALEHARRLGLSAVVAHYQPTEKNRPCLEFLQRCGWPAGPGGHQFRAETSLAYPYPAPVAVTHLAA